MNVTMPEKPVGNKRRMTMYISLMVLCIIAIGIAVYQFFADEKLDVILGITGSNLEADEQYEKLKSEFDHIFMNSFNQELYDQSIVKIDSDKDVVYTKYEKTENSINDYDINVHIPYININSEIIKKYNEEIKNLFEVKAENTLQTKEKNIIYTVEYGVEVENNILSLVIRSNLKQGNNAQRVIVKTYNYDLANNKEIRLNELMQTREISMPDAQSRINSEIEKIQEQVEELGKLGYNIFSRDSKSNIYKIDNTTEFFMHNGYLYLIYAYGNQSATSEMDIVIF